MAKMGSKSVKMGGGTPPSGIRIVGAGKSMGYIYEKKGGNPPLQGSKMRGYKLNSFGYIYKNGSKNGVGAQKGVKKSGLLEASEFASPKCDLARQILEKWGL